MAKIEGPDQFHSWVIALASCVINTLLSGISRATGIFYLGLIEVYGVTRLEANLPFTLRNVLRCLAGPVVGMLGQKYGVNIVSIIGSIFAISGIALCSIAPSIIWISIFWGGFHGIGVALANTLFQVTINQYFVKYRATAVGIALSGACLGSFIFPIVLEKCIDSYGLQGAFLLTGGLVMHVLPASMLLREPSWLQDPSEDPVQCRKENTVTNKLEIIKEINSEKKHVVCEGTGVEKAIKTNGISKQFLLRKDNGSEKHRLYGVETGMENPVFNEPNSKSKAEDQGAEKISKDNHCRTISSGTVSISLPSLALPSVPLSQERSLLKSLLSVYRNPMFHLISISFGSFAIIFDPLMIVIVDYVNDKGLDHHIGIYLISILALGDLIGRLSFGWITDKNIISIPNFMMIIQLIQGICIVLLPIFYTFELLMCLIVLYGLTAGTNIVMFPILVAKYTMSEQSIAIGCVAFFAGIISFAAPPLIGHFRDNEGSYDGMFYMTGSLSIITGLLWLFEPCIIKLSKKKDINH